MVLVLILEFACALRCGSHKIDDGCGQVADLHVVGNVHIVEKHLQVILLLDTNMLFPGEIGVLKNAIHTVEVLVAAEVARRH